MSFWKIPINLKGEDQCSGGAKGHLGLFPKVLKGAFKKILIGAIQDKKFQWGQKNFECKDEKNFAFTQK